MQNLPLYVSAIFIATTIYAVFMFVKAANGNRWVLYFLVSWLALHAAVASTGFYTTTHGLPPRFTLTIGPAVLLIILLSVTVKGKQFLDSLNLHSLTLLHVVRVPVEIVLFLLYGHNAVPKAMTFEGSNLDILSGVTALLMFFINRKDINKRLLLAWNIICLGLLLNIVIIAVLAAPFDFQQIAFDQPNIAVLYFPFVWLPACVVPLVMVGHLAAIRQLVHKRQMVKKVDILQRG